MRRKVRPVCVLRKIHSRARIEKSRPRFRKSGSWYEISMPTDDDRQHRAFKIKFEFFKCRGSFECSIAADSFENFTWIALGIGQ